MPSLPTRKLSQVAVATAVLAGDKLVLLRRAQDETDASRRVVPVGLPALKSALDPAANLRPGGPFEVVYRTSTTPGYPSYDRPRVAGFSTLADLDEALICFGCTATTAFSEDGPGSVYVPVYDAVGFTMHINKDGFFGPDNAIPARWALRNSVAAARANLRTWSGAITDWALNETLLYTLGTVEGFYQTKFAGGPFPAPTGPNDTYYRQVAPPLAAAVLTPNQRPDFRKVVAYESTATPGYAAGRSTIADILDTSALHTQVVVEFSQYGTGKTLEFVYDGAPRVGAAFPGLQLPREFGGGMLPVMLVLPDSPAATRANIRPITATQPTPPFVLDEVGTYTLASVEGFYRYKAPAGGTYAAPTGPDNANWHQVAPPVAATQPTVSLTEAQLVNLYNNQALGTYTGKLLFITNRAGGLGSVAVQVLGNGALALDDAYLFDPANADAPAVPVVLVVSATTTTTHEYLSADARARLQPLCLVDASGIVRGYATLAAVQAGNVQVDGTLHLTSGAAGAGVAITDLYELRADGNILSGAAGNPLSVGGRRISDAQLLQVTVNAGSLLNCSNIGQCQINGDVLALNCELDLSQLTIAGTLRLGAGTTVSGTPTTTGAGVVVDERGAAADTFSVLTYAASIAVDFNAASVRTLAATGNVAFTAAANIALLKTKELYITNTTGAAITLSFPTGWSFFPGPAPTSLAAGGEAALYLRCLGTNDSSIKARFIVGTSGTPATAPTVSNASFTAA